MMNKMRLIVNGVRKACVSHRGINSRNNSNYSAMQKLSSDLKGFKNELKTEVRSVKEEIKELQKEMKEVKSKLIHFEMGEVNSGRKFKDQLLANLDFTLSKYPEEKNNGEKNGKEKTDQNQSDNKLLTELDEMISKGEDLRRRLIMSEIITIKLFTELEEFHNKAEDLKRELLMSELSEVVIQLTSHIFKTIFIDRKIRRFDSLKEFDSAIENNCPSLKVTPEERQRWNHFKNKLEEEGISITQLDKSFEAFTGK